jgi:EAL domain-containing protein (putative c-di-GMP-specific phosphodiesterase class I)
VDGHSIVLTASAGIAIYPSDAQDLAGLTRAAEQAASTAKEVGRGQQRFFDEAMNARAASRLLQEIELRRAIGGEELRLHFQPKVDAGSGALVGAEALVRWQHPERGLLPPGAFIGLAEETGLILPLTDWVLERACRVLQAWRGAGLQPVKLSVNLAAASLEDHALLAKLEALTTRYAVSPSWLTLEVTETMMMQDVDRAVALLDRLRGCGYGLSLDDFGIGFSSLSHLKRLPLDELKIDRAFVTEAAQGGRDAALARGIISMGRDLGLRVVAEGVETQAQRDFLLRHDCPLQQGYLFSRPVSEDDFARMLGAPAGSSACSLGRLPEAAAVPQAVSAVF